MLRAIEDKVFSIAPPGDGNIEEEEEDSEDEGFEADMIAHQDEDINIEDDMVGIYIRPVFVTSFIFYLFLFSCLYTFSFYFSKLFKYLGFKSYSSSVS